MNNRLGMSPRRRSIAATSIIYALAIPGAARAQSAEAEALFTEGDALMKRGQVAEACRAFEASNRIEPRAGTLIRLGECREQNHELASAWAAYKDALGRVKDTRKRAIAEQRIAYLEPKLSYLTVSVLDASRIDRLVLTRNDEGLDPALWNRPLPVNGGQYVVTCRAPGHAEWRTVVTVPEASGKVGVEVPRLEELREPAPPPVTPAETVSPSTDGAAASLGPGTSLRKTTVALAGVSVLGVAAGIVLGAQAVGKRDDAHALCPDSQTPCSGANQADSLITAGQHRALAANIAFGVAGTAAIAAGVLWFTGSPQRPSRGLAVVPSVAPGETALSVLGRF